MNAPMPARPAAPAPLIPVAVAVTAGIVFDRYVGVGLALALVGAGAATVAGLVFQRRRAAVAPLFLWLAAGLLAAAWHHVRHTPYANDIGRFAAEGERLARLRGVIVETAHYPAADDPLASQPSPARTSAVLRVTQLAEQYDWRPCAGRARVWAGEVLPHVRLGEDVEILGMLDPVPPAANPGEFIGREADEGIRAVVRVKSADAVTVRRGPAIWSPYVWLARLRGWAAERMQAQLSPEQAGVAQALILGEQSALDRQQFDGYQRTGVFHVLAISGQHLVVLCGFLWQIRRFFAVSRLQVAVALVVLAVGYCMLTGARPPMVRAAVMVCTFCLGILMRRRMNLVNALALAWIVVAILNPSDVFQTGCQVSFLCVLVLFQVVLPLHERSVRDRDPLAILVERTRPHWQRLLLHLGRSLGWLMVANIAVWLAIAPLIAARYHLVSPVGALLTPPMLVLTSIALIAGFVFLLLAPLGAWAAAPAAWVIDGSLALAEKVVSLGEELPGGYWYCAGPPEWWLAVFYGGMVAVLLARPLHCYWKPALLLAIAWLGVALLPGQRDTEGELRCTFLAVGHGSCAVIETPDGRTLIYDAGSLAGPQVATFQIAPFLWERGIRSIDEVLLSHADLDHFNGVPALADRFPIAQVSLTPSFFDKRERGVEFVENVLLRRGIAVRTLHAGQQLAAGDVHVEVLHPPRDGPAGKENARSLVLRVTYAGRSLLLTGDLEPPGLEMVMAQPPPRVDVVLAPHHGSAASNTELFAIWAKASLVISSEGRELGRRTDPYSAQGAVLWRTSREGAVTVRFRDGRVIAETYRTRQAWSTEPRPEEIARVE
jgi:competence protein ComEC